ncbi:hypothetical protein O9993_09705 [Vibrio lentus]|nr:hypothetical protein [Vibrio lentus]
MGITELAKDVTVRHCIIELRVGCWDRENAPLRRATSLVFVPTIIS